MPLVKVVPYDSNWPTMFEEEAKLLKQALGSNCIAIYHIGSTSIPGLSAKPILDILPVVKNILEVDLSNEAMKNLGYEVKGEAGMAFKRFFQKGSPSRTHNIHVYQEKDPEISRYVKFRDWMRSHPSDALAYATLKLTLAQKFPQDIFRYCSGKDAFVASIDTKDGYDGYRCVQALTDQEWKAVNSLRKDPLDNSFKQKDHIHFVFYKNAEVIGYAHLQLLPKHKAILQFIAIKKPYQKLGFGTQLLQLCERWLNHQGFKTLLVQAPKTAYTFYSTHGYVTTLFSNPIYKDNLQNIQMGKFLNLS